jgi:protein-tyrosine phosphatase
MRTIAAIDVLIMCTGNICRSPMAEGLLRTRLAARGIVADVSSAGLSFDDRPATPEAVQAAAARGIDIARHRSRVIDLEMIDRADLIIAMERMHVREVVVLDPTAMARTFTMKELARRAASIGPREPGEPLDAWLERAAEGRRAADLLGQSDDDDVADPYGRSQQLYDRCAAELDGLVATVARLAWPSAAEGAA